MERYYRPHLKAKDYDKDGDIIPDILKKSESAESEDK